jgi:hypothetical protein
MVCSQSFWCRVLSGVLVVGSLSATGSKSGPSFSMPTMPSMAWWQKDKGDLASRAVEQPQPPSSAFSPATSPSSSVASQGNPYGGEANGYQSGYGERTASASGYPSGNTMNAGYDAGGYDTAGYGTGGYGAHVWRRCSSEYPVQLRRTRRLRKRNHASVDNPTEFCELAGFLRCYHTQHGTRNNRT